MVKAVPHAPCPRASYGMIERVRNPGGVSMGRVCAMVLAVTTALALGLPSWAGGPTKYNACGLLTPPELKAAVNANVDKADDRDVVIPSRPYKGETMSTCSWAMGATFANLNI